jgi:starvation-inducible DNA-binding protein
MNAVLASVFRPHFRDFHLLLDEQAHQICAMTDPITGRMRNTDGTTLRSIGHIAHVQRIKDNGAQYLDARDMFAELHEDSQSLAARLREVRHGELLENWINETERRSGFLFEASHC